MFEIRYYAQTESTNDDAVPLLGLPENAGAVLWADFQRAGHGRRGRTWVAPPGSSLLVTTILPRAVASGALWAVPFWTALGAADGIEAATGVSYAEAGRLLEAAGNNVPAAIGAWEETKTGTKTGNG